MKSKRIKRIASILLASIIICVAFFSLTACEKLEDWEDYIEENGWMALITSEEYKRAKLIGNKENSVVNGEAVLPTSIKGYEIFFIQNNCGISLAISRFDFMPNKLFIPGVDYRFSDTGFPNTNTNKKIIFLDCDPTNYKNGFESNSGFSLDKHPYSYVESKEKFIVPSTSVELFSIAYSEVTYGEFKGANVSYFYNYEDSPNSGYCWIDDLDAGDKINTIPMDPQREGYEFAGWYLEDACITQFNFEAFTMAENGELNLYAKWIQKQ